MNLLVLNQYFPPDRSATAILLGQWVEDISHDHDITIVCGEPTYDPESNSPIWRSNVRVHRAPLLPFSRSNLFVRLFNYFLFLGYAFFRSLTLPKYDVIVSWSDPPLISAVATIIKKISGGKFIFVSQDLYPEVLIGMKRFDSKMIVMLLRRMMENVIRNATHVVAIGTDMEKRLYAKGARVGQVSVIPNWQDLDELRPCSGKTFRKKHGIDSSQFVVMHSGNLGLSQDFETLFDAAAETLSDSTILYLMVGDGKRKEELEREAERRKLSNVRFLPYQPSEGLAESLSAADVHYVSLKPSLTGAIVPSKIYGAMAVGRAILANVSEDSDIAQITKDSHCGLLVPPLGKAVTEAIRQLASNRGQTLEMGARGRKWMEDHGGRIPMRKAYANLFAKCA